jgi:hypothetical protein
MNASRLLRKLRNLAMTEGEKSKIQQEPDGLLSALGFKLSALQRAYNIKRTI